MSEIKNCVSELPKTKDQIIKFLKKEVDDLKDEEKLEGAVVLYLIDGCPGISVNATGYQRAYMTTFLDRYNQDKILELE